MEFYQIISHASKPRLDIVIQYEQGLIHKCDNYDRFGRRQAVQQGAESRFGGRRQYCGPLAECGDVKDGGLMTLGFDKHLNKHRFDSLQQCFRLVSCGAE